MVVTDFLNPDRKTFLEEKKVRPSGEHVNMRSYKRQSSRTTSVIKARSPSLGQAQLRTPCYRADPPESPGRPASTP